MTIEPGAVLGPEVTVGPGTWIGAGAVLYGPLRLGEGNQVYPHAVLGGAPQDLLYKGEPTRLEIGDRNIFREGATANRASTKGGGVTRIGSDNLFMANSHVGHDCVVGDSVVLANGVLLGGHCHVGSYANFGGGSAVAQFVSVGRCAFLCGTSGVRKDLEPFVAHDLVVGPVKEPQPTCINEVALRRAKVPAETIQKLRAAYKVLFLRKDSFGEPGAALAELERRGALCPEVDELLDFIARKRAGRFGRMLSH